MVQKMPPISAVVSYMSEYFHHATNHDLERPLISHGGQTPGQSPRNIYILRCISLSFGLLSMSSIAISFYWFVRMGRSFRHDLIMLLMQSDFVKSLWFVIFPIVQFLTGPVLSDSAFCQVSGYFLTAAIEGSDIACLLLAIHTALSLFLPQRTGKHHGLFPYRWFAYAAWTLFPLAIASFAFARGVPAYSITGGYCYLRTDESWSRMALSWIPRYFILTFIFIMYGCIYIWVSITLRKADRTSSTKSARQHRHHQHGHHRVRQDEHQHHHDHPAGHERGREKLRRSTPPLADHGLIPSTPNPSPLRASDRDSRARQTSLGSVSSVRLDTNPFRDALEEPSHSPRRGGKATVPWNWSSFGSRPHGRDASRSEDIDPTLSPDSRQLKSPEEMLSSQAPNPSSSGHSRRSPSTFRSSSFGGSTSLSRRSVHFEDAGNVQTDRQLMPGEQWTVERQNDPGGQRVQQGPEAEDVRRRSVSSIVLSTITPPFSPANIFSILGWGNVHRPEDGRGASEEDSCDSDTLSLAGLDDADTGMAQKRERIRKQLRLLFVYPVVYIFVWLTPFFSHVLGYDDSLTGTAPLALLIISLISLSIQGFVDAMLFTSRERPWNHVHRGFWKGLWMKIRIEWWFGRRQAGRTREERRVGRLHARERRQREIEEEIAARAEAAAAVVDVDAEGETSASTAVGRRQNGDSHWWDALGDDGVRDVEGESVVVQEFV